jgi:FKBP-type peptidyl-prolyl cis-trans isomerase FkpA/FKBP-type peptidyl-prolyl cis-trans isomerase FklB
MIGCQHLVDRLLTLSLAIAVAGVTPAGGAEPSEADFDPDTLYVMGAFMGRQLLPLSLSAEELEALSEGLRDAALGRELRVDPEKNRERVQALQQQRMAAAAEAERRASQAYIDEIASRDGVVRTPSGLLFEQLVAGSGASPKATDMVEVHYHGTLRDGSVFDSSVARGTPAKFPLNRVIPCWTEGLQRMKVGGKARLVCPSKIAYGDKGFPPKIPAGAVLTFEVELLQIVE